MHGEITDIKGQNIDEWQEKTRKFISVMAEAIRKIV
jgi:Tfp pilus assembly protein PilO